MAILVLSSLASADSLLASCNGTVMTNNDPVKYNLADYYTQGVEPTDVLGNGTINITKIDIGICKAGSPTGKMWCSIMNGTKEARC